MRQVYEQEDVNLNYKCNINTKDNKEIKVVLHCIAMKSFLRFSMLFGPRLEYSISYLDSC